MYFVYKHTTPNSKVYIGITSCTPEVRWQGGYGYKNNSRFFKDILKYGWDNIEHEILAEGLTKDEALQMESAQITLHNSLLPQYGYNQTCTESSAHNIPVNQYSTDGTLLCTFPSVKSAAQSVNAHTSLISKACKHNTVSKGHLWKFAEDKEPLTIPEDLSRRVHKPHSRHSPTKTIPVMQLSKDGFLICTYNSIQEASELSGVNKGDITSCCKGQKGSKGRIKHTAGGYVWKYIEKEVG
jgi:hypothetical protein